MACRSRHSLVESCHIASTTLASMLQPLVRRRARGRQATVQDPRRRARVGGGFDESLHIRIQKQFEVLSFSDVAAAYQLALTNIGNIDFRMFAAT